jgi:hypothetical protein
LPSMTERGWWGGGCGGHYVHLRRGTRVGWLGEPLGPDAWRGVLCSCHPVRLMAGAAEVRNYLARASVR